MVPPPSAILGSVTAALLAEALAPIRANPGQAAILLDVDGTLSPIVEHAADAKVPEPTRQLLAAIARRYKIVACVTGRRAADARAMVSIGTISYLGAHGTELLRAGWTESVIDPKLEDWARRIHQFGREADTAELRRLRVRLEDKGTIVAFHWRGATDEDAARSALDTLASRADQAGLRTHWGRKVLEIRPPVRMDKGAGITSFLESEDVGAAMYAGDDATDLDAFRALAELQHQGKIKHGIRVGVRSDEGPSAIAEQADVVVDGTEGMRELLALLASD